MADTMVIHDATDPDQSRPVIAGRERARQTLTRRGVCSNAHRPTKHDPWARPGLVAKRVPAHGRGYGGEVVRRA